jgi:hypothetical protein
MKVYYEACDADPFRWKIIEAHLDGRYPKEEEGSALFTADSPPDPMDFWRSVEPPSLSVERVYEIDLPHSEEELAPYKCTSHDEHREWWRLPWYIVAGHPVKIMEVRIQHRTEHRVMGVPLAAAAQVREGEP